MVLEMQGRDADMTHPRYPAAMAGMTAEDFAALGARYLADTRIYRTGRPFFTDKMPNNFRHIGLIHLMLPNARIIDARREPMACCFPWSMKMDETNTPVPCAKLSQREGPLRTGSSTRLRNPSPLVHGFVPV